MTVFQSKKTEKWTAQVGYYDAYGKRRFLTETFETRPEAKTAEILLKAQALGLAKKIKEQPLQADITLGELHDLIASTLWRGMKSRKLAESRLRRSVEIIGWKKKTATITTGSLDKLVDFLLSDNVTGATVNRYLNGINKLLKAGYKRRDRNGCRLVPVLPEETPWQKESTPRSRWLSEDERSALLAALGSYDKQGPLGGATAAFATIALKTGARRSEILGVDQRTDVLPPDAETGLGTVTFRDTKNGTSREVPIDDECYELFLRYAPWDKPRTGSDSFEDRLYHVWRYAQRLMGLQEDKQFTPHCLRHTHATMMVENDVNLRTLQEQLGHKQVTTTQRYAHVSTKARKSAAAGVMKLINRREN